MLFRQTKVYQLTNTTSYAKEILDEKFEQLAFRECPPSLPHSVGWVSPIDEENAPLTQTMNGFTMVCLQLQEKILPAIVIRQELNKKLKEIQTREDRKIYQKEKLALKDEITITLLQKAFSKKSRLYAYIDTKNHFLILGTTSEKKAEQFLSIFRKTMGDVIQPYDIGNISYTLTNWLQHKSYPTSFAIEKSCILQDPNQEKRVVRCQQQDLFAPSIQSLLKDGYCVKQLALEWQDRISFVLNDTFAIQSIRFKEELIGGGNELEAETAHQKFFADFLIMTETMSLLINELAGTLHQVIKPDNLVDTIKWPKIAAST